MGITGLLPAPKLIQTTRKLSDFAGQTIAVDGYVWLHRGVYNCSVELATGKKTHKHNGVEPYIVFDGGLLPAKKGTENERRQKREDGLARANMLAAQGKHSQARDHYLKCVDLTPEMAYQVINALRVKNVQCVVAPYEADAQMAFLERTILTKDSDLLVLGCKNVLLELDHACCTTDTQFRTKVILSGCDLPSIPGIGLQTAAVYVQKHKTAEQCSKLAEQCFLHQHIYHPSREELMHLTDVGDDWMEEAYSYVAPQVGRTNS
ncbi:PIN domain-like protein [Schizophyllum commune]